MDVVRAHRAGRADVLGLSFYITDLVPFIENDLSRENVKLSQFPHKDRWKQNKPIGGE